MNVVLYGSTGKAGSRILAELTSRGHAVKTVSRKEDDLSQMEVIAASIAGADAVVSAYAPSADDTDALVGVTERLAAAVAQAGVGRLIVVGGAGSLEVAPGVTLLASGHLPAAWVPIAASHGKALAALEGTSINWTYFSPAGFFEPGVRTGQFRLGVKELIANAEGESRISMEDYAIALVDELETPRHERSQMSIGY